MENRKQAITIRLPTELKEKLQQQADRLGVSFNEMAIKLIREGMKSYLNID